MQTKGLTSREYFQSLKIIYIALLTGMLIIGGVFVFLNMEGQSGDDIHSLNNILQYIVPIIILGGILGGLMISRNRLKSIKEKQNVKEKLGDYRAVFILRLALLEGPAMMALIVYFLTGNYLYLVYTGLVIVVYLAYIPSKSKIANELELSQSERSLINDPGEIVAEEPQK